MNIIKHASDWLVDDHNRWLWAKLK